MGPAVIKFCSFFMIFIAAEAAEVTCPPTNPEEPDILPDRHNCTNFYICDNGTPWKQSCSAGLYFNPLLKVCDRPSNVVFCEYDDILYLKPHCDCSKYIVCDNGNLDVRNCASGFHFGLSTAAGVSSYSDPCQPGSCK